MAIVKVRASDQSLAKIKAAPRVFRLPKEKRDALGSDLLIQAKTAIRNKLTDIGYALSEMRNALGNDIGSRTLCQVLAFAAWRRVQARFDLNTTS
jgi:hypothetical protein